MPLQDELGKRMKEFYEAVPQTRLMRRVPAAIRIDGKAFHTFTRGFQKPFDEVLMQSMQETMKYLCENIQGCVLGYTQSDEITLILVDYKKLTSSAWFDYEVQKVCSVAASMATMAFNRSFSETVHSLGEDSCKDLYVTLAGTAMFDARCFNIPKEEVTNLIYWRQLDAARNSVQMVGQANFSHRELQSKSCSQIQDMLMLQKGVNWNDFPTDQKRGSCCIKETYQDEMTDRDGIVCERSRWIIDREIPIFKGDGRAYIDRLVYVGE
jgi:tRNA(His) 5'-end guanylyltransferase